MMPLECYTSRWKLIGLLGLCGALVALSAFAATLPGPKARIAGVAGVAFFGLGFVLVPIRMGSLGPQFVVNDEGVVDYQSRIGLIAWEEIRALRIGSMNSSRFLCIELVAPDPVLARLPRWRQVLARTNRAMGFGDLTYSFYDLTPGLDEVWAHIRARTAGELAD